MGLKESLVIKFQRGEKGHREKKGGWDRGPKNKNRYVEMKEEKPSQLGWGEKRKKGIAKSRRLKIK